MGDTFLNLANQVLRVNNEVEIPSAQFLIVTGIPAFAKDCVNFAINDILQSEQQWPFNHTATTQVLVADQQFYSLPSSYVDVDWDSFFFNKDSGLSVEAKYLPQIDRDEWNRRLRATDESITAASGDIRIPEYVLRMQDDTFGLTPIPDRAYSVDYEYWAAPAQLSVAADTTSIPDRYSWIIVQGATYYRYMQRDNEVLAGMALKKFEDGISIMRSQLINRSSYAYDHRVPRGTTRASQVIV